MHEHSTVIGIYFSSGQRDSDEAPKFVNRLTKGIIARSDSCVVVQLKCALIQDPTKLAVGVSSFLLNFVTFLTRKPRWTQVTNRGNVLPFTMEQTAESIGAATDALLAENCHRRLVDFEDHMGDKTADFRNFEISQQLSA